MKKCIRCGIDIPDNEKFCHSCGISQNGAANKYVPFEEKKSKKNTAARNKIIAAAVLIIAVIAAGAYADRNALFEKFYIKQAQSTHWDTENYPNITYKEAVDEMLSDVKWTQKKSQDNNGAEVTASGRHGEDDIKLKLTFVMNTDVNTVFTADKIMYVTSRYYINGEWKDYEVKDMLAEASERITQRQADEAFLKAQEYTKKHYEHAEVIYPDQGEKSNRNYFKDDDGRCGYTFWIVEEKPSRKLLGAIIILDNGKIETKDWTN